MLPIVHILHRVFEIRLGDLWLKSSFFLSKGLCSHIFMCDSVSSLSSQISLLKGKGLFIMESAIVVTPPHLHKQTQTKEIGTFINHIFFRHRYAHLYLPFSTKELIHLFMQHSIILETVQPFSKFPWCLTIFNDNLIKSYVKH